MGGWRDRERREADSWKWAFYFPSHVSPVLDFPEAGLPLTASPRTWPCHQGSIPAPSISVRYLASPLAHLSLPLSSHLLCTHPHSFKAAPPHSLHRAEPHTPAASLPEGASLAVEVGSLRQLQREAILEPAQLDGRGTPGSADHAH